MALRTIVQSGDPILAKLCRPVEKFDRRLAILLDDMAETMLAADGMGLAGPQVGVMRRLFVALEEEPEDGTPAPAEEAGPQNAEGPAGEAREAARPAQDGEAGQAPAAPAPNPPAVREFINPEILLREGEERGYEGCLSFPGRYGAVARPARVRVRAFNRAGEAFDFEGRGIMARCLCHEIDHLNGVTLDMLAEYYYDPDNPHDLDETLAGPRKEDAPKEDAP